MSLWMEGGKSKLLWDRALSPGDKISGKMPPARGVQASFRTGGALLPPHPGAQLSAVWAACPPGSPGRAPGIKRTSGSEEVRRGFPSVEGPRGPSGQPPEACGGTVSPLWPNSETEVPEGKERVKCKSPEEEVWEGSLAPAASRDRR